MANTNSKTSRKRVAGLDIIRSLAIVTVIGGHYFINTDFNTTPFNNLMMFILGMLQSFTLIGVPLFLMLTGYLNIKKSTPDKKYYNGIWRVIVAYIAFSIITILFGKYYLKQDLSAFQCVHSILAFDAIPYAWYIEMWIGLFLLTPFLNKSWQSLDNKKHRQILIFILFCCTSLPDFTNRYGMHLLPGYWTEATYPILCFYLGAYIKSYQLNIKHLYLVGIIIALCLFNPILSLLLANGKPMMHIQGSPMGIVVIPLSVCVFLLLYKADVSCKPVKALFTKMSLLSLNMYLAAYIFDQLLYPIWKNAVGSTQAQLAPYYLLIILSLVAGTFISAWAYEIIASIFSFLYCRIRRPISRPITD